MGVRTSDIDAAAFEGELGHHATTHDDGGSDEISIQGLSGQAADPQRVIIAKAGTTVGTRPKVNFVEGANVSISAVDNIALDTVDVTISATGGGAGSGDVVGPAGATANNVPMFADGSGKNISDSGITLATLQALSRNTAINELRLAPYSGYPEMPIDDTALSNFKLVPYRGRRISLYDSTKGYFVTVATDPGADPNYLLTGHTAGLPFDIFCYLSGGVPVLESLNWTNSTTRAVSILRVNGMFLNGDDQTRRYLGTCRPRSATTFHWVQNGVDSPAKFDLWNAHNRLTFHWSVIATTNTWAYSTAAWRQAQGSANYQVEFVAGLQEGCISGALNVNSQAGGTAERGVAFGLNSTTTPVGIRGLGNSNVLLNHTAFFNGRPPVGGNNYLAWLEYSVPSSTDWYGDNGANLRQSGMTGTWIC